MASRSPVCCDRPLELSATSSPSVLTFDGNLNGMRIGRQSLGADLKAGSSSLANQPSRFVCRSVSPLMSSSNDATSTVLARFCRLAWCLRCFLSIASMELTSTPLAKCSVSMARSVRASNCSKTANSSCSGLCHHTCSSWCFVPWMKNCSIDVPQVVC